MAATVDSDCMWVVERSKAFLSANEKHAARAWMLTARSLYPHQFIVQYEAFCLYVLCEEYATAANTLTELCAKFPKEPKMQDLAEKLCQAIQNKASDKEAINLKTVFELLPPLTRKMILLKLADGSLDPLHHGQITLVAMKLFPDLATTLGLDCYDSLSKTLSHVSSPVDNLQQQLLVTELIPLLASSPSISLDQPILRTSGSSMVLKTNHICQWLEVAASYHTEVIVQSLLEGKTHQYAGRQGWESLYNLFLLVCKRCGWMDAMHSEKTHPHLPPKLRWIGIEHISGYSTKLCVPFEAPRSVAIECFYSSVFLFFECVWNYFCHTFQRLEGDGGTICWALVEDRQLRSDIGDSRLPAAKRRKLEESEKPLLLLQAGSRTADQSVYESFLVAVDCWGFIHSSNTYRGEFERLCQQWGANEWAWLTAFRADMLLFKGESDVVKKFLTQYKIRIKPTDRDKPENLRILLQLVNCNLLLGDIKAACVLATELIALLPDNSNSVSFTPSSSTIPPTLPKTPGGRVPRVLRLVSTNTSEVFSYTIDIITTAVKEIALSDSTSDNALGQLLVLCQYQWPQEEQTVAAVMNCIQKRGSFNYPPFLNYVISVDILEEIMYLINHTTIQLSLQPQESSGRSRAVTRGVNSRAKEDLVSGVEQQLERSDETLEPILKKFFKQEKLCFIALPANTSH